MTTPQDLAKKVAEKSDQELLAMFALPDDWTTEALDSAKAELRKRGLDSPSDHKPLEPKGSELLFDQRPAADDRFNGAAQLRSLGSNLRMTSESNAATKHEPIFGLLSMTAPFIGGILIFLVLEVLPSFSLSLELTLLIIPLSPICGVCFTIAAWIRREQFWALPLLGLLINGAVIYFLIINRHVDLFGSMGCMKPLPPNQSPEPTAVIAAVLIHAVGRRWFSFGR